MIRPVTALDAVDRLALIQADPETRPYHGLRGSVVVERLFRDGTRSFEMMDRWLGEWVVQTIPEWESDVASAWLRDGPAWDGSCYVAEVSKG